MNLVSFERAQTFSRIRADLLASEIPHEPFAAARNRGTVSMASEAEPRSGRLSRRMKIALVVWRLWWMLMILELLFRYNPH